MPTTKHRINITANKNISEALIAAARREGIPVATKAAKLLEHALEIEEDIAWGAVIEQRMSMKNIKYVSHEKVWKRFISK